jgi:hypothetical protein
VLQSDVRKHHVNTSVPHLQCSSIRDVCGSQSFWSAMLPDCFVTALEKRSVYVGRNHLRTLLGKGGRHSADSASDFQQGKRSKLFGSKTKLAHIATHFFVARFYKIGKGQLLAGLVIENPTG